MIEIILLVCKKLVNPSFVREFVQTFHPSSRTSGLEIMFPQFLKHHHLFIFPLFNLILISESLLIIFLYIRLILFFLFSIYKFVRHWRLNFLHNLLVCIFFLWKYLFLSICKLKASVLEQTFLFSFSTQTIVYYGRSITSSPWLNFLCVGAAKKAMYVRVHHM